VCCVEPGRRVSYAREERTTLLTKTRALESRITALKVLRDTSALLRIMRRVLDARVPPGGHVPDNRLSAAQFRRSLAIWHRASLHVWIPGCGILVVEAGGPASVSDADGAFSRTVRACGSAV